MPRVEALKADYDKLKGELSEIEPRLSQPLAPGTTYDQVPKLMTQELATAFESRKPRLNAIVQEVKALQRKAVSKAKETGHSEEGSAGTVPSWQDILLNLME